MCGMYCTYVCMHMGRSHRPRHTAVGAKLETVARAGGSSGLRLWHISRLPSHAKVWRRQGRPGWATRFTLFPLRSRPVVGVLFVTKAPGSDGTRPRGFPGV